MSVFPFLGALSRIRLRHKLAVSLSIAALLPVVVASWLAFSVVFDSLDKGVRDETERQLRVGLSLLLRSVGHHGREAMRLAGNQDLITALQVEDRDARKRAVSEVLDNQAPFLPAMLVQVFGVDGDFELTRVIGNAESRFADVGVDASAEAVRAGLRYESVINIVAMSDLLLVRASAPVHDGSYRMHGVVVVSLPLDGSFADRIKSDLGTDVLIFAGLGQGVHPALSTFRDATGARAEHVIMRPDLARRLAGGESVLGTRELAGRQYAMGYTPLVDVAGEHVGIFGVAVDRAPLLGTRRAATRSLALGAAMAFVIALVLGVLLARRLTRPIARLHRGALAVAQGDLDQELTEAEGDEIADLASAFSYMTRALKENQERLAARMREIVALHDAGRAVSSVINLDLVLRKIVDAVARVLDVRLCALWLVESQGNAAGDWTVLEQTGAGEDAPEAGAVTREWMAPGARRPETAGALLSLRLGAARSKGVEERALTMHGYEGVRQAAPLSDIATEVAVRRAPLRIDDAATDDTWREAALAAGVTGSLLAIPLERKDGVLGVIVVGRTADVGPFSEADTSLLATFADQAGTAVENARLYEEVRAFNEELEGKVRERTAALTHTNAELERTLTELRETQSQLVLSERMAGLGLLVAGVAHEINSPSAAIRGSVDVLRENVVRLAACAEYLMTLDMVGAQRIAVLALVSELAPELASRPMDSPVSVRRAARGLAEYLSSTGVAEDSARPVARKLAEIGMDADGVARLVAIVGDEAEQGPEPVMTERVSGVTNYLAEYVLLRRNALTIGNAIERIQRIVGALKTYCHLDQEASRVQADLHEGIENTLVILDYVLRSITVVRKYGKLPPVPVYVDELNQVWTNLIHNAVQALQGKGRIVIETGCEEQGVWVRVIDDGPGVAPEILPRIFEPFFTTKPKGEGSGLGLGIVKQILDRHDGRVTCQSEPGRTCFEVWLPRTQVVAGTDEESP